MNSTQNTTEALYESDKGMRFKESKEIAETKGHETMKEYILHVAQLKSNQDLTPGQLAKKYKLPNPTYVSKLLKSQEIELTPNQELVAENKELKKEIKRLQRELKKLSL